MSAPTSTISAQIVADLGVTLARLRLAREIGDWSEARVCERRLNWLVDKLPRKDSPC